MVCLFLGFNKQTDLETVFEDHWRPDNLQRRFGHTARRALYDRKIRRDWRLKADFVVEKIRFQGCICVTGFPIKTFGNDNVGA